MADILIFDHCFSEDVRIHEFLLKSYDNYFITCLSLYYSYSSFIKSNNFQERRTIFGDQSRVSLASNTAGPCRGALYYTRNPASPVSLHCGRIVCILQYVYNCI